MNIKIKLPFNFLQGEFRNDYYISLEMKKVWAVELDLFCELLNVCKKHNIKVFAEGGTLLGAVRHKGMIPWDDDIDVAMTRSDYIKLQKLASKEFKYPYFFQDENTDPGSLTGHGRIINLETTAINRYHLNKESQGNCHFKQCVFIDIFVFDNVPDDLNLRNSFIDDVYDFGRNVWNQSKLINRNLNISEIFKPATYTQYENLMAKYAGQNTKWLYTFAAGKKRLECSAYLSSEIQNIEYADFEFIRIPIVSNYQSKLDRNYGNWHEFVKGGSAHGGIGDIFFDTEHPCEYYLDNPVRMKEIKQKFGIND